MYQELQDARFIEVPKKKLRTHDLSGKKRGQRGKMGHR
jgi:hypothetical protein